METKQLAPSVIDYFRRWDYEIDEIVEARGTIGIDTHRFDGKTNLSFSFFYKPELGTLDIQLNGEFKPAKYYNNHLPRRIERLFELNDLTIIKQMVNGTMVAITVAGDKLPNYRYDTEEQHLFQREKGLKFQEWTGAEYVS